MYVIKKEVNKILNFHNNTGNIMTLWSFIDEYINSIIFREKSSLVKTWYHMSHNILKATKTKLSPLLQLGSDTKMRSHTNIQLLL